MDQARAGQRSSCLCAPSAGGLSVPRARPARQLQAPVQGAPRPRDSSPAGRHKGCQPVLIDSANHKKAKALHLALLGALQPPAPGAIRRRAPRLRGSRPPRPQRHSAARGHQAPEGTKRSMPRSARSAACSRSPTNLADSAASPRELTGPVVSRRTSASLSAANGAAPSAPVAPSAAASACCTPSPARRSSPPEPPLPAARSIRRSADRNASTCVRPRCVFERWRHRIRVWTGGEALRWRFRNQH